MQLLKGCIAGKKIIKNEKVFRKRNGTGEAIS